MQPIMETLLTYLNLKRLSASAWTGFSINGIYAFSLLLAGSFALLFLLLRQRRSALGWSKRFERARKIVELLKPGRGLESCLDDILELFDPIIEAPIYAFYIFEPKSRNYVLKAVRHSSKDFGKVRPSYSCLASFAKENYHPPMFISAKNAAHGVTRVNEGDVPLLSVSLGESQGMVRIGPFMNKLPKRTLAALQEIGELIGQGVGSLIMADNLKQQAEVVISSGRAMQHISHIALNPDTMIDLMIRLSIQTIDALGGCYIEKAGSQYRIRVNAGLSDQTLEAFGGDDYTLQWFESLLADTAYRMIRQGDSEFYQLPPYLAALGMQAVGVLRLENHSRNFLVCWFDGSSDREQEEAAHSTLHLIHKDAQGIIALQKKLQMMSGNYAGILKGLAQLLDNLSPYTVGYSDLMSRYSIVVAKEMGIEEAEIRDIALAAYLSNIGMLGISAELYQKEGKYTEQEFEMMKLHTEVGASIVRTTIANEHVAELIEHHHERMDGNGYPAGLKGDDIPVGARIIAVLQTFMAKINGRRYRDPLPFHEALKTLRAASGTQLDSHIVDAFIHWFERKWQNPNFNARSLGTCWEMCCVPSSICESCPVYEQKEQNCWEVEDNNCQAHGKSCETCYVRSEYMHRREPVAKS